VISEIVKSSIFRDAQFLLAKLFIGRHDLGSDFSAILSGTQGAWACLCLVMQQGAPPLRLSLRRENVEDASSGRHLIDDVSRVVRTAGMDVAARQDLSVIADEDFLEWRSAR
jgi:hypothetical protein